MRPTKIVAASLAALAFSLPAQSPVSPDDFIVSRQGELTRYGKLLFHVDFSDSHWAHRTLPACSALPHHAFAVYERPLPTGAERYLVSYSLDTPPARPQSLPWRGGILAAPLASEWGSFTGTRPDENNLLPLFNHVLAGERHSSTSFSSNRQIAICFATLSGEDPLDQDLAATLDASHSGAGTFPFVSDVFLEVKSSGPAKRLQNVHFDATGLLREASVTLSPRTAP